MVTVTVNVTLLPTFGVALLTTLFTDMSACATGTGVFVLLLLPGVGSFVVVLTVAVLAYVPLASTVATIWILALAPLASVPMPVQAPVPLLYAPTLGVADTNA